MFFSDNEYYKEASLHIFKKNSEFCDYDILIFDLQGGFSAKLEGRMPLLERGINFSGSQFLLILGVDRIIAKSDKASPKQSVMLCPAWSKAVETHSLL